MGAQEAGSGGGGQWRWWAAASAVQLAAGATFYRRGCGESSTGMPFKAFAIATLFVGAAASAATGALQASGLCTVDDAKEVGVGIRRWIQAPPRETN